MTLREEFEKLAKVTKKEGKEKVAELIRRITEKEGEMSYQIVKMMVEEKMKRGYTKEFSLKELQERLPWKKSMLIEKMLKLTAEGIMKHEKRRYQLDKENELVKKMWNYYNKPSNEKEREEENEEKRREIRERIRRKQVLMEKLEIEEKKLRRKYREQSKKEQEILREKISEITYADTDMEEELRELITKQIMEVLGVTTK